MTGVIAAVVASAPFQVIVSPTSVFGSSPASPVTSNETTATVYGNGTFAYLWERVSGDANIQPTNEGSSNTRFSRALSSGSSASAVFACRVTEVGTGVVIVSSQVLVLLERT